MDRLVVSVPNKMSNRKYLGIAIALQLLGLSMAGNILALMGMTSHSHHIW